MTKMTTEEIKECTDRDILIDRFTKLDATDKRIDYVEVNRIKWEAWWIGRRYEELFQKELELIKELNSCTHPETSENSQTSTEKTVADS